MIKNTSFDLKNPTDKEEKLIAELVTSLNEVTHVFMKLNHPNIMTNEIFGVLRDASIGYCGGVIMDLMALLSDKNQVNDLVQDVNEIFSCYIDKIKNEVKGE